jgi:acyl carrier protein
VTPPDTSADAENVRRDVRRHILEQYLDGADASELTDDMPLITGGILDSISTVMLVSFLEKEFGVEFQAHEMGVDHLNTIDLIVSTVQSKR